MDSSKEELIEIEKLFMKLNFYRTDDVFKGNIEIPTYHFGLIYTFEMNMDEGRCNILLSSGV